MRNDMTPEEKARCVIDDKLCQSGWVIQDLQKLNLSDSLGVAVREFPTSTGAIDYALFVDGKPVGSIEAKREDSLVFSTGIYTFLPSLLKHKELSFLVSSPIDIIYFVLPIQFLLLIMQIVFQMLSSDITILIICTFLAGACLYTFWRLLL